MTPLSSELARVVEGERTRERVASVRRQMVRERRADRRKNGWIAAIIRVVRRPRTRRIAVEAPYPPER